MNYKYLFTLLMLILVTQGIFAYSISEQKNFLEILNGSQNKNDLLEHNSHQDVFYPPEELLQTEMGITTEQYKQLLVENATSSRNSTVSNIWGTSPLSGTVKIPVLLVNFSDRPSSYTQSEMNNAFNSDNYVQSSLSGISISKYFYKQSYGDLNLVFDVYDWRTAPSTYSYYSTSNTTVFQLGLDSINLFDPYVNYSQYDNDNDGRLDGIVIIYAGAGAYSPSGVWPQARILKQYTGNPVDGKYLGNTAFVPEKSTGSLNAFSVVTATHEFSHVLGLMDLYSINPSTGAQSNGAIRQMTMMAYNVPNLACAIKPINLDVWSRYFFGWINPAVLTTDSNKQISLRNVNDYSDAVIMKNSNLGSREFFIVENRYRNLTDPNNLDKCMFSDSSYSHGGLAIYHVDEQYIETNYPNNAAMYDADGNFCSDVSHSGIVYEQNGVDSCSTSVSVNYEDLYFNSEINGCNFSRFDENQHMCGLPYWYWILDLTSNSYTGVSNTLIRTEVISPENQATMISKLLVGEETMPPIITVNTGTYLENTSITIQPTDVNSTIYYTIDGTEPTINSINYTTPIILPVGNNIILKAVAKKPNFYISESVLKMYTIIGTVATPTSSQPNGIVNYGSQITVSTTTMGAIIRYTLDNSEPNEISSIYSTPFTITGTTVIKAKAYKTDYISSQTATYNYTSGTPQQNIILSLTLQNINSIAIINNDNNTVIIKVPYGTPIGGLIPIIQLEDDCEIFPAATGTSAYNLVNPVNFTISSITGEKSYSVYATYSTLVFPPVANISGGVYNNLIEVELTSITPGARIFYTTDGTIPTKNSQLYFTPINIDINTTLKAIAYTPGNTPVNKITLDNLQLPSHGGSTTLIILPSLINWLSSEVIIEEYTIVYSKLLTKISKETSFEKDRYQIIK